MSISLRKPYSIYYLTAMKTKSFLLCLLLGCTALSKSEFAVDYNNTARADEIASYVYDSGLADDLIDSELACKFDTLYELSECFEVE